MVLPIILWGIAGLVAVGIAVAFWNELTDWIGSFLDSLKNLGHKDAAIENTIVILTIVHGIMKATAKVFTANEKTGKYEQHTSTKEISESEIPAEIMERLKKAKPNKENEVSIDITAELKREL